MKVSEIAQRLDMTSEQIFAKLRNHSTALDEFSPDGETEQGISFLNDEDRMPHRFSQGYIPEYSWGQLTRGNL
jgi:hypothetical protein